MPIVEVLEKRTVNPDMGIKNEPYVQVVYRIQGTIEERTISLPKRIATKANFITAIKEDLTAQIKTVLETYTIS